MNAQASDRRHTLSRADRSDMEVFLENVFVILPLLGVDAFRPRPVVARPALPGIAPQPDTSPVFVIVHNGKELARGQEIDGSFVVAEGSRARPWHGTATAYMAHQERLIAQGDLVPGAVSLLTFTRDVEFPSVSAASAVVSGRNSNGRTEWKLPDGTATYATWQNTMTGATL